MGKWLFLQKFWNMVWEEGSPSFFKATNSLRKTEGYNKKLIISGIFFLREEKNTILHIYSCIYKISINTNQYSSPWGR